MDAPGDLSPDEAVWQHPSKSCNQGGESAAFVFARQFRRDSCDGLGIMSTVVNLPRRAFAMNYKLLLWDFDGTLADTLSIALGIYNRMAAKRSFRPITDPDAVRGMGMREFLKTHDVAARHVPFAFNTFLREIRRLAPEIRLNAGIADAVREAASRGVAQGVVSSNDTRTIQACLEANHIAEAFAYVSGTSRIFGKERRIRKAMSHCGVDPADVLYIGDEVRDIEAAQAAGLDIASVTWGLNSEERLRSEQPTFVVNHPLEIVDILQPDPC